MTSMCNWGSWPSYGNGTFQ